MKTSTCQLFEDYRLLEHVLLSLKNLLILLNQIAGKIKLLTLSNTYAGKNKNILQPPAAFVLKIAT